MDLLAISSLAHWSARGDDNAYDGERGEASRKNAERLCRSGKAFLDPALRTADLFNTPPSCDAVNDAFLGAVAKPTGPFLVNVQRPGESHLRCSRVYDPDGVAISDYDAGER